MVFSSVAIECIYPDSTIISCSGFKISKHLILTNAALVSKAIQEYLTANLSLSVNFEKCILKFLKTSLLEFKVYEIADKSPKREFQIESEDFEKENESIKDDSERSSKNSISYPEDFKKGNESIKDVELSSEDSIFYTEASIEYFWNFSELQDDLTDLFPKKLGWRLSEGEDLSYQLETLITSSFVLLFLDTADAVEIFPPIDLIRKSSSPKKGYPVVIESSPFGTAHPHLFLNSVSKGIVSNISKSGRLFITDARCVFGCEGAPAFMLTNKGAPLCGFVLAPFCWLHGQWLGLTLMCSALELFRSLAVSLKLELEKVPIKLNPELPPLPFEAIGNRMDQLIQKEWASNLCSAADLIRRCLVSIDCLPVNSGSSRGTGFIVDGDLGLIVTCAHVIQSTKDDKVAFTDYRGERHIGNVIFKTKAPINAVISIDADIWDIAIVAATKKFPNSLSLSDQVPPDGSSVLSAGFGLLEPRIWEPLFSRGIISKTLKFPLKDLYCKDDQLHKSFVTNLLRSPSRPIFIQTTCDVYAGSSGGPIIYFHPTKGLQAIGIVSCSANDDSNKVIFPHINLASCLWLLIWALKDYRTTKDKSAFDVLHLKGKSHLFSLKTKHNSTNLSKL